MNHPYFTIFTPVYNGEKHISRVFESIIAQTYKDFEYIIVNDGSSDNTPNLIKTFIIQHPEINIIYIEQENSGKHIAWNKAVHLAKGQLFVPADADDYFFPETLSFFHKKWNSLSSKEQMKLSGINVLCFDNDTDNIVGNQYPTDGMKSNNLELQYKFKIRGEKWGCIRLDLLKSRPFPIVKGSHFPESYLWLHLAKNFQVICFNIPLRRYYTTETGIIQSGLSKKNIDIAKIIIRYNLWFFKNFGMYVLVHSPQVIFKMTGSMILSIIEILKKQFGEIKFT